MGGFLIYDSKKADLINQVYNTHNVTKEQAVKIVEAFLKISKDRLISGDNLMLSGFGKFSVKEKQARRGRNPQTGEELMLDARKVIIFKPSGKLRSRLNGG